MQDDITKCLGNHPYYEALKDFLKASTSAIAFVGSGASAGLYPLMGECIELLVKYAVSVGKMQPEEAKYWKKDNTYTEQERIDIIVRRIGDSYYRQFLRQTFGPKSDAQGKRYTPIHSELLHLPFRLYLTVDFDPALQFARLELRPNSLSIGVGTWQDRYWVQRLRTGDIFTEDSGIYCVHGSWEHPETVVLTTRDFHEYDPQHLSRDALKELLLTKTFVFVGCSLTDMKITPTVNELMAVLANANPAPRHFAILPWFLRNDGSKPDAREIEDRRANLEDNFHVRVLFYPVVENDHSSLYELLNRLVRDCGGLEARIPRQSAVRLDNLVMQPKAAVAKLDRDYLNSSHDLSPSPKEQKNETQEQVRNINESGDVKSMIEHFPTRGNVVLAPIRSARELRSEAQIEVLDAIEYVSTAPEKMLLISDLASKLRCDEKHVREEIVPKAGFLNTQYLLNLVGGERVIAVEMPKTALQYANVDSKTTIATVCASEIIRSGDVLLIDGGTTTQAIYDVLRQRALGRRDLKNVLIITNSYRIADYGADVKLQDIFKMKQLAGDVREDTRVACGPLAVESLRTVMKDTRAQIPKRRVVAFLGTTSFTLDGCGAGPAEKDIKIAFVENADPGLVFVVGEHTKFRNISGRPQEQFAKYRDITVITDGTNPDAVPSYLNRVTINALLSNRRARRRGGDKG